MFEKLKARLKGRFPVGDHQLCHLYDEIMKHFGVDGIEGEDVARCIMRYLHETNYIEVKPCMVSADMFYMLGE